MSVTKTPNLTMSANVAPAGRKGQPQVLEDALGLGHRIARADQLAVLVHRDLTGDRHQPSARADSVAVPVAGRHPRWGKVMLDVRHGTDGMTRSGSAGRQAHDRDRSPGLLRMCGQLRLELEVLLPQAIAVRPETDERR